MNRASTARIVSQVARPWNIAMLFGASSVRARIAEAFEPEGTNLAEMQRAGWQAILDNFKRNAEAAQ